jgi:murein DD-endopeptidase MepM/ murein hydrolase activator NlpD
MHIFASTDLLNFGCIHGIMEAMPKSSLSACLGLLLLLGAVLLGFQGATAQTTSKKLEQLQRDLRVQQNIRSAQNARASRLERDLRDLNTQEKTLLGRVKALNERLSKLQDERAFVQGQLDKTTKRSEQLQLEIKTLELRIAYGKKQLQRLLVALDRERSNRYVKLMARAENAFDLSVKSRDLDAIQDVNLDVIDDLRINAAQLVEKNLEYRAVIAKLNEYQRNLEAKKEAITQNRANLNANITRLRRTQRGKQALQYEALQASRAASAKASVIFGGVVQERNRLAEIRRQRALEAKRRAEAERQRQIAEARRLAAIRDANERSRQQELETERQQRAVRDIRNIAPIALPINVDRLQFPMPGGRISANFGFDGNDYMTITGSPGAAIIAAADGIVTGVQSIGANYGYSIVIAHTDNGSVSTVYGNLQFPSIGYGQNIRAGQTLGYVGGGDLFPNDELHFYVARGTIYIDPRPYL